MIPVRPRRWLGAVARDLAAFDVQQADQLGTLRRVQQECAHHEPQLFERIGERGVERRGQPMLQRLKRPVDGRVPQRFLGTEARIEQAMADSQLAVERAQGDSVIAVGGKRPQRRTENVGQ